jgi:hypothetical protein
MMRLRKLWRRFGRVAVAVVVLACVAFGPELPAGAVTTVPVPFGDPYTGTAGGWSGSPLWGVCNLNYQTSPSGIDGVLDVEVYGSCNLADPYDEVFILGESYTGSQASVVNAVSGPYGEPAPTSTGAVCDQPGYVGDSVQLLCSALPDASNWTCSVDDSVGGTGSPCTISIVNDADGTPWEPFPYWGDQDVSTPRYSASVTCSVQYLTAGTGAYEVTADWSNATAQPSYLTLNQQVVETDPVVAAAGGDLDTEYDTETQTYSGADLLATLRGRVLNPSALPSGGSYTFSLNTLAPPDVGTFGTATCSFASSGVTTPGGTYCPDGIGTCATPSLCDAYTETLEIWPAIDWLGIASTPEIDIPNFPDSLSWFSCEATEVAELLTFPSYGAVSDLEDFGSVIDDHVPTDWVAYGITWLGGFGSTLWTSVESGLSGCVTVNPNFDVFSSSTATSPIQICGSGSMWSGTASVGGDDLSSMSTVGYLFGLAALIGGLAFALLGLGAKLFGKGSSAPPSDGSKDAPS